MTAMRWAGTISAKAFPIVIDGDSLIWRLCAAFRRLPDMIRLASSAAVLALGMTALATPADAPIRPRTAR